MQRKRKAAARKPNKRRQPQHRVISKQELTKHRTRATCWTVIHGKVYDVTAYLDEHPGGAQLLLRNGGADSTSDFEGLFHSAKARGLLDALFVGVLEGAQSAGKASLLSPLGVSMDANNRVRLSGVVASGSASAGRIQLPPSRRQGALPTTAAKSPFSISLDAGDEAKLKAERKREKKRQKQRRRERHERRERKMLKKQKKKQKKEAQDEDGSSSDSSSSPSSSSPPSPPPPTKQQTMLGRLAKAGYRELQIGGTTRVSHNTSIFRIVPGFEVPTGHHIYVAFVDEEGELVKRAYTPLSARAACVDLMVKRYPDGPMSSYIHALQKDSKVLVSQPRGNFQYTANRWRHVGMVAAGTGLAPMFQVIRSITENPQDTTRMSLVFANRTAQDILLRTKLEQLCTKHPLFLWYLLSRDESLQGSNVRHGHITEQLFAEALPPVSLEQDTVVLVCGPDGFADLAHTILTKMGYTEQQIHVFKG